METVVTKPPDCQPSERHAIKCDRCIGNGITLRLGSHCSLVPDSSLGGGSRLFPVLPPGMCVEGGVSNQSSWRWCWWSRICLCWLTVRVKPPKMPFGLFHPQLALSAGEVRGQRGNTLLSPWPLNIYHIWNQPCLFSNRAHFLNILYLP